MSVARLNLAEAKQRLDVAALWQKLSLPGKPGKSICCPFHDDSNASFSVYTSRSGVLRWKCFGGCGEGGPVEMVALALDLGEREACRRLLELAGDDGVAATDFSQRSLPPSKPVKPRRLLMPVGMHRGSRAELRAVADRRGLSLTGVALASRHGLLWFASPRGCLSWIVTDAARMNAQARCLDGSLWEHIGDKKAWTLPGSRAPWPIGAREADPFPFVVLVEGAPDLLAACHFIVAEGREQDVAPVAMLGATNHIPEDALLFLANKRVRIFPHTDKPGRDAAVRWTEQLERVGCTVDAFDFTGLRCRGGGEVSDLNDLANVAPDCLRAEAANLERVMPE